MKREFVDAIATVAPKPTLMNVALERDNPRTSGKHFGKSPRAVLVPQLYEVVELPGIEPVSGCWYVSRTSAELRNDSYCDSTELTYMDTDCAQDVPSQSLGTLAAADARV